MTSKTEPKINAVLASLVGAPNAHPQEHLKAARDTLETLIARPHLLRDVNLVSTPGAYTRNLLFGSGDISIWAMTWAPGSRTSIHDHRCSCCFGIVHGRLTETRYQVVDEAYVTERERVVRGAGFIDCLLPSGPNIHMMSNETDEEVLSIHIYGYDHHIHSSSVLHVYTAIAG